MAHNIQIDEKRFDGAPHRGEREQLQKCIIGAHLAVHRVLADLQDILLAEKSVAAESSNKPELSRD